MPKPGGTSARGYGPAHRRLRAKLAPSVDAGLVDCWRCGQRIQVGQAWDLGHDDNDRSIYRGPEHAGPCNRHAAALKANANRARPTMLVAVDDW